MRIVAATSNPGKLRELRALFPPSVVLEGLSDLEIALPPETGLSFVENAVAKASFVADMGYVVFADDSGLEVDVLDGRPGIFSARFAGPKASDTDNIRSLLDALAEHLPSRPIARFRTAVALSAPNQPPLVTEGIVEGCIVSPPRGSSGFGYDPVFEIHDFVDATFNGRTMAELTREEKNRISHRSRAYRALVAQLLADEHQSEVLDDLARLLQRQERPS
jgi:XTP/dITP diphosphohydrolase